MPKIEFNKNTAAFSLILVMTIAIIAGPLAGIISVSAADVDTYAFLSVFPNPVGVGDNVVVSMSVQPLQPTEADVYYGFEATITKPDGTTETKGPFTTSPVGIAWFDYEPSTVGTYSFQFSFPGQTFSNGDYYKPVTSPITELVVQQDPLPGYPTLPLPTDYWTRPISAENREWGAISGNWLMDSYDETYLATYCSGTGYNPYSQAPRSAHIMWTKELMLGGIVGGEHGSTSYYSLQDYESHITPPIIMNGRLYYRIYETEFRAPIRPGFACVDLRTGEELWRNTEGNIDIGQLYDYRSGNQMGVTPWLWDIGRNIYAFGYPHTFKMYDAFTGELVLSFENGLMGGVPVFDDDTGALYIYYLDGTNNWMAMWNQTLAFEMNGLIYATDSGVGYLRPSSPWFYPNPQGVYEWSYGLQWNVTIPDTPDYPGDIWFGDPLGQHPIGVMDNVMLVALETFSKSYHELGYDINTGQRLWIKDTEFWTWKRATGEDVYANFYSPTMTWTGYDVKTGNKLWTSDPMEYPWGLYDGANAFIAEGKLIEISYDGHVHAIDITNGEEVWKFYGGDTNETPYGTYPFYYGPMIADGVVFAGQGEHSPTQPFIRGFRLHAIDGNTGEGIWSIAGSMSPAAIADGYFLAVNGYDNRLYCFGKGPSATTVDAPKIAVQVGQSFTITGTVTDQSTGATGTPAISDEDMSAWMEYLYMAKPFPSDAKGVEVTLSTLDPNGNNVHIGEATSDTDGNFGFTWAPEIPGTHQIIATFAGSESYGSSYATCYLSADEAPQATPPPDPTPAPITDTYVLGIGAAILVAVIVIGLVLIMMMRKK